MVGRSDCEGKHVDCLQFSREGVCKRVTCSNRLADGRLLCGGTGLLEERARKADWIARTRFIARFNASHHPREDTLLGLSYARLQHAVAGWNSLFKKNQLSLRVFERPFCLCSPTPLPDSAAFPGVPRCARVSHHSNQCYRNERWRGAGVGVCLMLVWMGECMRTEQVRFF